MCSTYLGSDKVTVPIIPVAPGHPDYDINRVWPWTVITHTATYATTKPIVYVTATDMPDAMPQYSYKVKCR